MLCYQYFSINTTQKDIMLSNLCKNASVLVCIILTFTSTSRAAINKAAVWKDFSLSGNFKLSSQSSPYSSWKNGEGNVFFSFGKQQSNSYGGDTKLQILQMKLNPLQLQFGLKASHCLEVSLSPDKPSFTIPGNFKHHKNSKPHNLTVGHIYLIRCNKIVFLLDLHEHSFTKPARSRYGTYKSRYIKCSLRGRYTILSTTMTDIGWKNRIFGGSAGIKYSLPFIPLSIFFDSKEGIGLSCSGKIPTPIGVFEVYKNVSSLGKTTLTIIIGNKKYLYDLENRPFSISLPNDLQGKSKIVYDGEGSIIVTIPRPL